MPIDGIRTRVVSVDTAKHLIIPIEALFVSRFGFSVHKQHKLWNDAQLKIAMVTRFRWYFASNTTVV